MKKGMQEEDLFEKRGAFFSPDRRYRYTLWRVWAPSPAPMLWIMLNPSTADERINDATIERCERRAREGGHGGLLVANIFALRGRDPKVLYRAKNPVGARNDEAILSLAHSAGIIVCGWGAHGSLRGRGREVKKLLDSRPNIAKKVHVLGLNADGSPKHPLYVSYATKPRRW